jgi:hypothetical protein
VVAEVVEEDEDMQVDIGMHRPECKLENFEHVQQPSLLYFCGLCDGKSKFWSKESKIASWEAEVARDLFGATV